MRLVIGFAIALSVLPANAAGQTRSPKSFIETTYVTMVELTRQGGDVELEQRLDALIDEDELLRRSFGEPCPTTLACVNYWKDLSKAQRAQLRPLVRRLVHKTFKTNLRHALDREMSIKAARQLNGEWIVDTESRSRSEARAPALQVVFVLRPTPSGYRLVDMVTEGAILTKNYYDQFQKMMTTEGQGYAYIVKKLTEKTQSGG